MSDLLEALRFKGAIGPAGIARLCACNVPVTPSPSLPVRPELYRLGLTHIPLPDGVMVVMRNMAAQHTAIYDRHSFGELVDQPSDIAVVGLQPFLEQHSAEIWQDWAKLASVAAWLLCRTRI